MKVTLALFLLSFSLIIQAKSDVKGFTINLGLDYGLNHILLPKHDYNIHFFEYEKQNGGFVFKKNYNGMGLSLNFDFDIKHELDNSIPNFKYQHLDLNTNDSNYDLNLTASNYYFYYDGLNNSKIFNYDLGLVFQKIDLIAKDNEFNLSSNPIIKPVWIYVSLYLSHQLANRKIEPRLDLILPSFKDNSASMIDVKINYNVYSVDNINLYANLGVLFMSINFKDHALTGPETIIKTNTIYLGFNIEKDIMI